MYTRYNKFKDGYLKKPEAVLSNVRRSLNGYMYGNLNADLGMEFMYMDKIRWNVLVLNSTISFTADDQWEEKRDEMALGPEQGWQQVTITWGGNYVTNSGHSSPSHSVTLPGFSAASLDMVAETAGDFLISVVGLEQYGALAQYSVIDDGTYIPPQPETSHTNGKEFNKEAVAAISVVMCLVAVALFALLFIVQKKRSNEYMKTLDESSTIVFNPTLGMNSSHSPQSIVQCSWCHGPHGAQDCTEMHAFLQARKVGSATQGSSAAPLPASSKLAETELTHLENI